jgi:hypothetical protein
MSTFASTTGELQFPCKRSKRMQSTRVMRASGAAGVLAAVLILGGLYLATAWGRPGTSADAGAWAAWAQREEGAIEIGVYVLLVPGLLLFLCMFAALAALQPTEATSTRLAGYGALAFVALFAAAGVLSSTTASAFGFYDAFEDPTAVTVFTGLSAGYHLQFIGVWSLAMTMLATAAGFRNDAAIFSPAYAASIVLAVLAVAASFFGFGVIFCLVWILAVSVGLLRWTRPRSAAVDPNAAAALD